MVASDDLTEPGGTGRASPEHTVSPVRMVLWFLVLGAGLMALHRLGATALSPPAWSPSTWMAWWSANEPLVAAMSVLRILVLTLGWYLLAVTALTCLSTWGRAASASRVLRLITVRSVRDLMAAVVGVAMVSATSSPAAASTLQAYDVTTPVAVHLTTGGGSEAPGDAPADAPVEDRADRASGSQGNEASDALRRLREGAGRFSEQTGPSDRSRAALPPSVADPDPREPDSDRSIDDAATPDREPGTVASVEEADAAVTGDDHLVVPGESFWSIARDRLRELGASADEVAIAAYWLVLIEANRDRLVVADEPDLILPGQRLVLPDVQTVATAETGS